MSQSGSPQGWSAYIPVLITASTVLVGALLGQIIAHSLALRRANIKERHLAHEKLFAPVVGDVITLLEASTTGGGQDTNRRNQPDSLEQLWNDVLGHIRANISHARAELLRVALVTAQGRDYDVVSGQVWEGQRVRLGHAFMAEYYDTIRSVYPKHDLKWLLWLRYKYRLWAVLTVMNGTTQGLTPQLMSQSDKLRQKVTLARTRHFEADTEAFVSQSPDRDAAWRYLREHVFSLDPEYLADADRLKDRLNGI